MVPADLQLPDSPPHMLLLRSAISALLLIGAVSGPARAGSCADRPISARGDPSRFELLAKAKARGNWRAKVRAMPALGAAYANWSRALAADYRCDEKDSLYVCTAVAHPCRP
jgi:hypothetical protein